jgi:hypothetical protein
VPGESFAREALAPVGAYLTIATATNRHAAEGCGSGANSRETTFVDASRHSPRFSTGISRSDSRPRQSETFGLSAARLTGGHSQASVLSLLAEGPCEQLL